MQLLHDVDIIQPLGSGYAPSGVFKAAGHILLPVQVVGVEVRLPEGGVGVVQHLALCAQQRCRRADDENTDSGEDDAREEGRPDEEAEIAVGLFPVALAQRDAHDGAAAGAQHEAHRADQHRHGHDEVDGGKSRLAHKVRDAQAIHDAVDGSEQHGADAGQHEPQKAAVVEMVGQLYFLL